MSHTARVCVRVGVDACSLANSYSTGEEAWESSHFFSHAHAIVCKPRDDEDDATGTVTQLLPQLFQLPGPSYSLLHAACLLDMTLIT